MNLDDKKYIYIRSLILLGILIILHYTYKFLPNVVFQIFGAIDESVFQHMKIGFYSYIIFTIIEYFTCKKKIADKTRFLFSRIFSTFLIPWVIFMFFFFTRVIYPWRMHFVVEIISAQSVVFVSVLILGFIELETIKIEVGKRLKIILVILIIILIIEFTAFSFYLPWHDVLGNPYA